tara:strand:- start:37 stop:561 length:525 start_codon:yes stop_codon:yes gene_type:complete
MVVIGKKIKFDLFNKKNNFLFFLIILNLVGSLMWFFKFPVFRYGYGYLISSFSIIYSLIILSLIEPNYQKLKKATKLMICILFIGILSKYSFRIYENINVKDSPWPNIYSDQNLNKRFKSFPNYKDNKIVYYNPELSMCYYTKLTPCTNMTHEITIENIQLKLVNGYKKYSFIK